MEVDIEMLENAGLVNEEYVQNQEYRKAFTKIMAFRGIFDLQITAGRTDTPMGHGLEASYIHAWVSDNPDLELSKDESDFLRRALSNCHHPLSEDQKERWAHYCLKWPVYYNGDSQVYLNPDTSESRGVRTNSGTNEVDRPINIEKALESSYNVLTSDQEDE
jgi:hypothetical protein